MALNLGPLNVLLRLQGADKFKRETRQATSEVAKLGKAIGGLIAIQQVTRQFVEATQVFAEFERGMVRVGAVTNSLGTKAFAGLTDRAQDLAKTTEFTARQVADAMGFMGMAGMKTNQIFEATPAVLQLASAGMVDVASAADTVTNIMAGYGLKTEDLSNANNVLVATFTNSNTSLQQLGQSFKYVGPVAKSAGVQFKEAAAVIGLMGNAGIQADMAGTALRGTIIKLLDPTAEGAKIMRQYGINVQDSNGKLKPMVEIFRQLEPIADDSAKMIELFGLRAGPGMQAALTQGTDALENLISKIDGAGNIAERIAQAQLETLDGKIKIMKSNAEALQIALGDALEPTSEAFVSALSRAAQFAQYIVEALSFARDDVADTSEIEAGMSRLAAQRAKATAQYEGLQKAIEGGFADVYIQEKLTGFAGLSPEAALGGLEMQIDELTDKIAHLGKKGFKIDLPKPAGPAAPKTSRPRTFVEQIEGAAGVDAVRALFEGMRGQPIMGLTEMSNKEFDAFMESFKPEVIIDHSEATKEQAMAARRAATEQNRLAKQARATGRDIEKLVGGMISGIRGDSLGATFGAGIGGAIGGAIGGPVGTSIGSIVGQTFAPFLDVLTKATNVFKPLIDVVNEMGVGLFAPLVVAFGPTIERLAVIARVVLLPAFEFLGNTIGSVQWLFEEMWTAGRNFQIWLENLTRGDNDKIPYIAGKSFDQYMQQVEEARRAAFEALNEETHNAADNFRELNEELTNVPIGVKRLRSMQYTATRGVPFPGMFNQPAF